MKIPNSCLSCEYFNQHYIISERTNLGMCKILCGHCTKNFHFKLKTNCTEYKFSQKTLNINNYFNIIADINNKICRIEKILNEVYKLTNDFNFEKLN